MNNNNKVYMMIEQDQLTAAVKEAMKSVLSIDYKKEKQENVTQLGEYVSQYEAMKMLNRKTTWFHNKRKSGELPAKKSANQWWYKKSDLENFINNGVESLLGL